METDASYQYVPTMIWEARLVAFSKETKACVKRNMDTPNEKVYKEV
jgi:hypothetical protein